MEAQKKCWSSGFVHFAIALSLLSSVQAQCNKDGFILTGSSGRFSSPNYPSNYPNSRTCRWIISVPQGHLVQLSFQTFLLETCLIPSVCSCDHVEIRDGSDGNSPRLGRFCGENKPPSIQSTGRFLWVEFDTDLTRNKKGFEATYTAVAIPVTVPTTTPTAIPVTVPTTSPTAIPATTLTAVANVCFDAKHPPNCSKSLTPICCHDDGPSCCRAGGSRCSDDTVMRDYCPRPSDDPSKGQCCLDDNGRPSCCDRFVCNGWFKVGSRGVCIGATAGLVIGGIFILAIIILCLCFLSKHPEYLCFPCITCVMCCECCDNQKWKDHNCCDDCHCSGCKGCGNCGCRNCCKCNDCGDCDCGGCDCGDCDCGSCDCGGCDCGGCDCGDCCVM